MRSTQLFQSSARAYDCIHKTLCSFLGLAPLPNNYLFVVFAWKLNGFVMTSCRKKHIMFIAPLIGIRPGAPPGIYFFVFPPVN